MLFSRSGLNYTVKIGPGGRLESVFAKILPQNIGKGTGTTVASRSWAQTLGQTIDDAGHGSGRNLGGPGGVRGKNIFPQNLSVNRGQFMRFEKYVAAQVNAGKGVFVRVVPKYNGIGTRPFEVLYQVRVDGKTMTKVFKNQ